jgi:flagellar motor switch protein FliN/FliY
MSDAPVPVVNPSPAPVQTPTPVAPVAATPEVKPNNAPSTASKGQASLDMLMDVPLKITVELGRTRMSLRQTLDLVQGSVIELDRLAGDPVDVFVNERLLAKGEVVVVDDKFAVRITELIDPQANTSKP